MYFIKKCPICETPQFEPFLTCKDHTVSHETFTLVKCSNCHLVITSPRPQLSELGKYYLSDDYISHSKTSKGLFNKLYQLTKKFALRWKIKLIQNYAPSKTTMLDVGCGTGDFLLACEKKGITASGVEPSALARKNLPSTLKADVFENLDQTSTSFDVITMWHVLEHLPDLNETIQKLKARLNANGTMFIAVPNHQSQDAEKYKEYWAGYDVPRHLWHFTDKNISQLMNKHGLAVSKIIPMKLDSFYVSMLSEKYIAGHNGVVQLSKGFYSGLTSNIRANKTRQYSSLIYIVRK